MSDFNVNTTVTKKRVEDLLCSGMEGSYSSFTIIDYVPAGIEKDCEFAHLEVPFKEGGAILMQDKYGDSKRVYRLDRVALQRGLDVLAVKNPYQMSEFINENEDAITGDYFIQCALLGDIVYG